MATHDGQTVSLDAAGNTLGNPAKDRSFVYGAHTRMLEPYGGGVLQAPYNYFRDCDPLIGRYVESDPGLEWWDQYFRVIVTKRDALQLSQDWP